MFARFWLTWGSFLVVAQIYFCCRCGVPAVDFDLGVPFKRSLGGAFHRGSINYPTLASLEWGTRPPVHDKP
jgi:hypothetical protein